MEDMRIISRGQVGLMRQRLSLTGKVPWFYAWDLITPMHYDLCVFPILPFLMREFYHGYLVSALSLHVGFMNEWSREIGQVNTKSFHLQVQDMSTHIQCFFIVSYSPRYPLLPGIFHFFCYVLVTKVLGSLLAGLSLQLFNENGSQEWVLDSLFIPHCPWGIMVIFPSSDLSFMRMIPRPTSLALTCLLGPILHFGLLIIMA